MFQPERVRGLRHLRQLCDGIGKDFEFRGNIPTAISRKKNSQRITASKWVVRWDQEKGGFFVYRRGSKFSGIFKPAQMRQILPGLYTKQLWTCKGLEYQDILKWPWQIKLAREQREHKFTNPTSGAKEDTEPQPVVD